MALSRIREIAVRDSLQEAVMGLDAVCIELMQAAAWTPNGSSEREYFLGVEDSLARIREDLAAGRYTDRGDQGG